MTRADATTLTKIVRRKATPQLRVVEGGIERDPSVRWDRVRNARARITAGYYDRPEVLERVLTAVLDEIDEL